MDPTDLFAGLGSPAEVARRLGISEGLAYDLRSGRRPISLRVAAKLEMATGRTGVVSRVVAYRVERARAAAETTGEQSTA
ncbi:MAG: hypothetical protein ACREQ5_35150 [Candidatus Dormibacteria bacterium]